LRVTEVLVTGGGGFIGRSLLRQLVAAGYRTTVLDNFQIGSERHIPADVRDEVEWVQGDSRDRRLIGDLIDGKDAIIHLAAPSSFLMYEEDPTGGTMVTIEGFLNILEGMRETGVSNLVYASTSAVYEGNPLPYREDMTIAPPDLKALSKKVNEEMAAQYSTRYGIRAVGLRPFSVYGPGEFSKGGYANIISLFAWAMVAGKAPVVWGDGNQTRDFIYVDDAARSFLTAMESDVPTGPFNVGTGRETSFIQVIDLINQYLGTDFQPQYVSVPISIYAYRLLADTIRAEKWLGFHPRISVEEGVKRVVDHARERVRDEQTLAEMQMYFESLPSPAG
jgi:nucleoside-diphosphate-sugar epimerase